MERGLVMVWHSILIAIVLYVIMVFLLGQSQPVAEDRSILIAGIVLVYMVLFGHSAPGKVNTNIMA
jgi:hypothetical protein